MDASCHNYCFEGICVWLLCTPFGCDIETSVKVSHYNPDLLVSVFDKPGDNPWIDAESIYGDFEKNLTDTWVEQFSDAQAGGGHSVEGGNTLTDHSLRFKEVTAIGHPLAMLGNFLSNTEYFCPSEATAFMPYYSSGFDAWSWRLGFQEMFYLYYLLPGIRVVGKGGIVQQWGPVWPRTGFIKQKDDVKAAAVIAQRAGNIVTKTNQPHIYQALNSNNYNKTWLPGELVENDKNTGVWQMLVPKEDEQCYVFGENDVLSESWSKGRQSEDNRYAFTLWRPYACCKAKGAFLFDVPVKVCL